jgi:hypothetical protein
VVIAIVFQPWGLVFSDRWQPVHVGYDDVAVGLAAATRPGEQITTNVLGHLGYSAISLRLFDLHGLTEPSIAELPRQADSFGKEGADVAGRRNNIVLVVNRWPLIRDLTRASTTQYVALTSAALTSNNIFIAVRANAAKRYADVLRTHFHARITGLEEAYETWAENAPRGLIPNRGP